MTTSSGDTWSDTGISVIILATSFAAENWHILIVLLFSAGHFFMAVKRNQREKQKEKREQEAHDKKMKEAI